MACPFCATGQGGLDRNLSTAEIVEQFRHAAKLMEEEGGRLSNVVFMGMGEPLANYKRVVHAVRQITGQDLTGFGLSQRNVTVSTVGLAPAIRKLADEDLSCTLAVSLHTPDDELRDSLVPVNNRWPVEEVLDAARYYADKSGRRVSIEYALIRDKNDQDFRADMLGQKLHRALGSKVHVNVIPLNPTPGSEWDAAPKAARTSSSAVSSLKACRAPSAIPRAMKSPPPAASSLPTSASPPKARPIHPSHSRRPTHLRRPIHLRRPKLALGGASAIKRIKISPSPNSNVGGGEYFAYALSALPCGLHERCRARRAGGKRELGRCSGRAALRR